MEQDTEMRPLGELEAAIMDIIWTRPADTTVREVLLCLRRTPPPGYTTVATVMNRLVEKGVLRRTRSGKVDLYRPVYDREGFQRRVSGAAVRGLVHEFGDVALAHFAAALEGVDPDRLARLKARLDLSPPKNEKNHEQGHRG